MNPVHIFDSSALIALFDAHPETFTLFQMAEAGLIQMVWPACAIAEANTVLQSRSSAWEALLLARVTCTPLTEDGAIEVGLLTDQFAVGHVVHEVRATGGAVVTQQPDRYRPWAVPLYVI